MAGKEIYNQLKSDLFNKITEINSAVVTDSTSYTDSYISEFNTLYNTLTTSISTTNTAFEALYQKRLDAYETLLSCYAYNYYYNMISTAYKQAKKFMELFSLLGDTNISTYIVNLISAYAIIPSTTSSSVDISTEISFFENILDELDAEYDETYYLYSTDSLTIRWRSIDSTVYIAYIRDETNKLESTDGYSIDSDGSSIYDWNFKIIDGVFSFQETDTDDTDTWDVINTTNSIEEMEYVSNLEELIASITVIINTDTTSASELEIATSELSDLQTLITKTLQDIINTIGIYFKTALNAAYSITYFEDNRSSLDSSYTETYISSQESNLNTFIGCLEILYTVSGTTFEAYKDTYLSKATVALANMYTYSEDNLLESFTAIKNLSYYINCYSIFFTVPSGYTTKMDTAISSFTSSFTNSDYTAFYPIDVSTFDEFIDANETLDPQFSTDSTLNLSLLYLGNKWINYSDTSLDIENYALTSMIKKGLVNEVYYSYDEDTTIADIQSIEAALLSDYNISVIENVNSGKVPSILKSSFSYMSMLDNIDIETYLDSNTLSLKEFDLIVLQAIVSETTDAINSKLTSCISVFSTCDVNYRTLLAERSLYNVLKVIYDNVKNNGKEYSVFTDETITIIGTFVTSYTANITAINKILTDYKLVWNLYYSDTNIKDYFVDTIRYGLLNVA